MSTSPHPYRLSARFLEKIWGTTDLAPWFPVDEKKIGEVWFQDPADPLPILLKFIFTSEKLSVQVHPGDAYARAKDNLPGKIEMWHVLRAAPGACLAAGFHAPLTRERLRESALSGEIEELLEWLPVQPGDTLFIPTGTVHAIGAGIALCEIQQMSDTTYRLYDYGRPRPLHLDRGVDVATLGPWQPSAAPSPLSDGWLRLAACSYFATDSTRLRDAIEYTPDPARFEVLIVLRGQGQLAGQPYRQGEMWKLPAGAGPFSLAPSAETELLRTYVPAR
ncbi:MAG: class I mannose-6-phosphate isomerase [Acidobacteria bacterium]|nr:class I mannose-6-phosphate isomerase [Acidobacteriota bacterium]